MIAQPETRRQFYKSFVAKALKSRSYLTRISDRLTETFGSTTFLTLNALFFTLWIAVNLNLTPFQVFDPFPFGLLTMIVSLEAIFLSIFVLVSQNRTSYVDNLREELHLQVNLVAEEEVTKILKVLAEIRKKVGITKEDPELDKMIKRIDTNYIERSIVNQIANANKSLYKDLMATLSKDVSNVVKPSAPIKEVVSAIQKGENAIQEKLSNSDTAQTSVNPPPDVKAS